MSCRTSILFIPRPERWTTCEIDECRKIAVLTVSTTEWYYGHGRIQKMIRRYCNRHATEAYARYTEDERLKEAMLRQER